MAGGSRMKHMNMLRKKMANSLPVGILIMFGGKKHVPMT